MPRSSEPSQNAPELCAHVALVFLLVVTGLPLLHVIVVH
jgi:hypothetical protein